MKVKFDWYLIKLIQVLILLLSFTFYSQEMPLIPPALSSKLENLSGNHVQEEVYIQTSKNIYETGEDLWFKGTVLNTQYFTPSANTKALYISLLQLPEKKVVWEEKYAVVNGFTDGHIYLRDTLQPGEYALVAQTGFSVNPDEATIKSVRKIEVIQNISALENRNKIIEPVNKKADGIDFQLMPEGGHLVAGVTSRVAFKAVDREGNPVEVNGTLYENNKAIPGIKTLYGGMGSFYITPAAGVAYSVKLDGYPENYLLPTVKPEGQVLQMLYSNKDVVAFRVSQSNNLPLQKMYIRLQIRGLVYNTAEFDLKSEKLIKLQLGELPQGIAEVTLYNSERQPVAERLVFVNEYRKIHITSTLDKTGYGIKEKVRLKLMASDEKGKPVVAHLGVSISDDIYRDPKESETIESYYQLSAQIKGRIYDPGYYFNTNNKGRQQALDLLLLTQGWRAYQWNEANLGEQNSKKQPYVSDTLTGSIYAKNKKAAEVLGKQYMLTFTADDGSERTFLEVNNKGNYTVLPEYLQSAGRGYIYFKLFYGKDYFGVKQISDPAGNRLAKFLAEKYFEFAVPAIPAKKAIVKEERFKAARNVNMLKEVVLTARAKKKRRFSDKYMGQLDSLARPDDYVCHLNVLNCPRHPTEGGRPVEGQIYKDPNTDMLMAPYRYPSYTEEELLEKFSMTRIKGYYPPKEFYNPVYDAETIDNTEDFRNTLYWKPNLITNANGTAEVEFFTSDINSAFRVVVEGVSGNGLLGSVTSEFKVEKKEVE